MNATNTKTPAKVTIPFLLKKKPLGEKISCLTAYDYPTARLLDEAGIDLLLVGDSLGMTKLGYSSTLPVTMEEVMMHLAAVRRGTQRALLVADMPYGSYHASSKKALENAISLLKQGGAEAVKIEGGRKRCRLIERMIAAEIPVMGHLGLTPQSIHMMGGYKVQGTAPDAAEILLEDALLLQEAGVFSIVLEGIPAPLAQRITRELQIPTIGIGAGVHCDGQILVVDDLLGITYGTRPKFVRQYADLKTIITNAASAYISDCRSSQFPSEAESYHAIPLQMAAITKS